MATFNSVLIGKAKGKVGNVVLTAIKGQNIVKALNDKPANPRSVGQTDNRVQMSNAVLAWQYLAMFFAYATALTKSTESVYNAFVRLVKSGMSSTLIASRVLAAKAALALDVFVGNWFSISGIVFDNATFTVSFNANGVQWVNTMKLVLCTFMNDGSDFNITIIDVDESSFNSGSIDISSNLDSPENKHAYIYDTASNKITNIK
jgi:hypothetical protein